MTRPLFTNNASSTLASGISNSDLSLTVATGEGARFPNPGTNEYFLATLESADGTTIEIVKVTARSTDTFTIVRAQDNTSAAAFSAGATIELRWTALLIEQIVHGYPHIPVPATGGGTFSWMEPYNSGFSSGNFAAAAVRALPLFLPERVTFDRIQVEVTTLGASSLVRLGVYSDDGRGKPLSLLDELGTIDSTTTGLKPLTINKTYGPGKIWLAAGAETATVGMRMFNGNTLGMPHRGDTHNATNTAWFGQNPSPGSFPASWSTLTAQDIANTCPSMKLRVA